MVLSWDQLTISKNEPRRAIEFRVPVTLPGQTSASPSMHSVAVSVCHKFRIPLLGVRLPVDDTSGYYNYNNNKSKKMKMMKTNYIQSISRSKYVHRLIK